MKKTGIGLLAMLLGFPASAQSLSDAFDHAWSRTPSAATLPSRQAEAKARAELAAGLASGPPALSVSNLNDRLSKNRGKQEWEVEMALPLWLPGQRAARMAEASDHQQAVNAQLDALKLQLAGEVREVWWALAAARNSRDLAAARLSTANALESDVRRRYQAGEMARMDSNLIQVERLAAEAELAEASTTLLQAGHAYLQLTGDPAPALLAAEPSTHASPPFSGGSHPALMALAATVQLARAKLKLVDESRRDAPELAVRVVRDRADMTEAYANSVGIKVTIPFSSGPRVRQDHAVARAEVTQAETELALMKQKIELDQQRARFNADIAARQLTMAQQRQQLTADNVQLAEKSFVLGESDLSALLRARAAALEARALFGRQTIYFSACQSRLQQAMGVLP